MYHGKVSRSTKQRGTVGATLFLCKKSGCSAVTRTNIQSHTKQNFLSLCPQNFSPDNSCPCAPCLSNREHRIRSYTHPTRVKHRPPLFSLVVRLHGRDFFFFFSLRSMILSSLDRQVDCAKFRVHHLFLNRGQGTKKRPLTWTRCNKASSSMTDSTGPCSRSSQHSQNHLIR